MRRCSIKKKTLEIINENATKKSLVYSLPLFRINVTSLDENTAMCHD